MRSRFRSLVLAPLLFAVVACGGGGDSAGSPTAPSSSSAAPPPSGVPSIAGTWDGTADFERAGNQHLITAVRVTITQNDTNVEGTVRFPAAGYESWRGTFTGSLRGTVDTEFVGSVSLQSEPATGTGVCSGQMTVAGRVTSRSMRWEAASLNMTPSAGPTETQACLGLLRNIAWIFNR